MAGPVRGDVVKVPFRFSDLSGAKVRPALVLCELPGNDLIICQITSKPPSYGEYVKAGPDDFTDIPLPVTPCYVRPLKLFSADSSIIQDIITHFKDHITANALKTIQNAFS